jgi:transposase
MTPGGQKNGRVVPSPEPPRVATPHAAGIDIHAAVHRVAVPPDHVPPKPAADGGAANPPPHVRRFGACTADLALLADRLQQCGITGVALESTGVYRIPLLALLQRRGFAVHRVDPRQTTHAPGRPQSDVLGCQWLQRLHSYGLLTASFRPEDQVAVLRGDLRQRHMRIRYAGRHARHLRKARERMNVKLPEVASDPTAVTGRAIIQAIPAGEREPRQPAKPRHERCHRTGAASARARHGNWRAGHLFARKQARALYQEYQRLLRACDAQLEARRAAVAGKRDGQELAPKPRRRGRKPNEPACGVRPALRRRRGHDLTVREGIDDNTALVILSAIGTDRSKWPPEKHFTSWLGLCPPHQGSAGKIKSRRVRRGRDLAARAFRLAARGCHHAKDAPGALYRRIQARGGGIKAVLATARTIAERVYRLLKYGAEYVRQGVAVYEAAYRERLMQGLASKAKSLGSALVALPGSSSVPEGVPVPTMS